MSSKKVSVIIPTYNRGDKITKAVESIEKNHYPKNKIEIIIIDDCSTDNTHDVILKLKTKYRNIKTLKTLKNSGPATTRNKGIKNSSGKYILFTDDDGILPNNLLKEYTDFLEKNKKVAGVGGGLKPFSNNIISKIELMKDRILGIADKSTAIGRDLPVGFTSNMMYRKKVLNELGYFNEKFRAPAGEDFELRNRICKKYDLASMPIYILHNHDYDFNYLLNLMIKQGLHKNSPKSRFKKIIILIFNFPILVYNIIKKTLKYRQSCR